MSSSDESPPAKLNQKMVHNSKFNDMETKRKRNVDLNRDVELLVDECENDRAGRLIERINGFLKQMYLGLETCRIDPLYPTVEEALIASVQEALIASVRIGHPTTEWISHMYYVLTRIGKFADHESTNDLNRCQDCGKAVIDNHHLQRH